jgi:hypothetical protein
MTEPRVLNPSEYTEHLERYKEREDAAKAERAKVNPEVEASRRQRFLKKVRGERQQRAERLRGEKEVINAMTPAEYDAWKQNTPPPSSASPIC